MTKTLYLTKYTTPKDIQIIPFVLNLRKEGRCLCVFLGLLYKTNNISQKTHPGLLIIIQPFMNA